MNISIGNAILEGAQVLREAGLADARRESGSLVAHVIGRDRSFVITHADEFLENKALDILRQLVNRRAAGEPLQYLTGHQEFFQLDFEVTPDVLIPRPETELIVETALELLSDQSEPLIADIGTGSGCIGITLLHEIAGALCVATDISIAALAVAKRNGVSERLTLIESDGFAKLDAGKPLSLIASNPPYVSESEMRVLPRDVQHEPRAALDGGADGLKIIRRLVRDAPTFVRRGGYFVFEIGFGQSAAIEQLIDPHIWELVGIKPDLQSIARTVVLRKR